MGKENNNILFFLSFCIEQYKMHKGLSGCDAIKLFDQYGITDHLAKNYDVLHTQSSQWMMQEIDEIINSKKR
ncbi:MAG: DUF3791 domain-containing protein [Bacteroidaceae bacterium]|nr:DUF3791 domain-containing protein [Bacteroidaceae bacterium]MBO6255772.1 DUF3791 domain-containing protein [Bacteroidaceae bacterium]